MAGSLTQSKLSAASGASTTFDATPASGSTIIVVCWSWEGETSHTAPTDNKGNTYSAAVQAGAASHGRVSIWYAYNVTSSATFTINAPGGPTNFYYEIAEWAGLTTTDPLDKTNGTTVGGPTSGATGALTQADEVIVAGTTGDWNDGSSITVSGSFVQRQEITSQAVQAGETDSLIVAATTTQTASWTVTGGAQYVGAIATFKAATAAAVLPRRPVAARQAVATAGYR